MQTFRYINKDNLLRFSKYVFGFVAIYAITIIYVLKEYVLQENKAESDFKVYIAAIFVVLCCLFSIPFLRLLMQIFFEKIVVTEDTITHHFYFRKLTLDWKRLQYFIRLPSRGFFTGLIIYYEMGDFKRKIKFESTISQREELIAFIRKHVGKMRSVRRVFR
ncbi:MAG: hypothetical protein K8T10_02445 [Candidatus Eremiobacteraeota bacterium]|nr:hypothetical protein [Candidatus Eremiobacteraeota bacterium]